MAPPPPPPISLGIETHSESYSVPSGKGRNVKTAAIAGASLVLLLAGVWIVVPKLLAGSAEKLAKQGRHVDASKKLKLAAAFHPMDLSSVLNLLGRELRLSKNYPDAQKALEQSLKKNPNDFVALKELGMTQNESGQGAGAMTTFQKYLEIRPDDIEAVKWIGEIAFDEKNYEVAAANLEKYVKGGQGTADEWKKLGIAQYERKDYGRSAESFKGALGKNKDLKDVHGYLGMIQAAQMNYAEAVSEFRLEIALSPERTDLKDAYADAAQKSADTFVSEKKYSDAISALQEGLKVPTKSDASFHYQLANLFAIRKKRSQALSHLAQALKADGSLKSKAKRDSAFTQYRALPAFKKIVK